MKFNFGLDNTIDVINYILWLLIINIRLQVDIALLVCHEHKLPFNTYNLLFNTYKLYFEMEKIELFSAIRS